jgi:hypothetical protein
MITQKVKDKFNRFATQSHPSNQHFSTFYHFGSKSRRIVEMGVWLGYSSWAWVASAPEYLRCVDIGQQPGGEYPELEQEAIASGIDYAFAIADTGHGILREINSKFGQNIKQRNFELDVPSSIPFYEMDDNIDLLYIDTYHSYTHLKAELAIHAGKVNKYLVFHDTFTFGEKHEYDGDVGLNFAIREFLDANPNWQYLHKVDYGDGLTVLGNMNNVNDVPNMDPNFKYPAVTL